MTLMRGLPGPVRPVRTRWRRRVGALVAFAIFAASCGGDAESTIESGVTRLLYSDDSNGSAQHDAPTAAEIAAAITKALADGSETAVDDELLDSVLIERGLVECSEVPNVDPGGEARPSSSPDLDPDLLRMLSAYTEQHPRSYAGLWLDGEATGGLLLAMSDDIGLHVEAIMADLGGEVWEAPFSAVQVPYSAVDLQEAVRVISGRRFAFVETLEVDVERNRVTLDLFNPSPEELEELALVVDPGQICVTVTVSDLVAGMELAVLPQAGGDSLLTCDEEPFPASALDNPVPLATFDHPAARAMIPFLDGQVSAEPDAQTDTGSPWIVLSAGTERALFAKYGESIEVSALATSSGGVWEVNGWTFGCDLKVGLPNGLGRVIIFVDPSRPFDDEASSINVLVSELTCTGGQTMGNRLLGPQVVETDTQVILAFAAISRPVETFDCPTNPFKAVTIPLGQPLAGRQVVNGMQLPPGPLQTP